MSDSWDLLIHRASHRAGQMATGELGQEKEWQGVRSALATKVISPPLIHTPGNLPTREQARAPFTQQGNGGCQWVRSSLWCPSRFLPTFYFYSIPPFSPTRARSSAGHTTLFHLLHIARLGPSPSLGAQALYLSLRMREGWRSRGRLKLPHRQMRETGEQQPLHRAPEGLRSMCWGGRQELNHQGLNLNLAWG